MSTQNAPQLINGRYEVVSRLGEGGQAQVLRVRDRASGGVERALKRLLPVYAEKKKLRARFEAEARAMSAMKHPNLLQVFDVATDGPLPYFVMELIEGGSLQHRLEGTGKLPPRLAVSTALQICAGLEVAHAAGIIHRDMKPHNVLVGADGTCKIMDFGIARMGETGLRTRAGAALGTEGFMAPEQASDAASVDVRADVYSVGMTLYVLLTGDDPWHWMTGKGAKKVPAPLLPILQEATEDAPEKRHPTVRALADALRAALDALPPDPPGVSLLPAVPAPGTAAARPDEEAMTRIVEHDTPPGVPARPSRASELPTGPPASRKVEPDAAPASLGDDLLGDDLLGGDAPPAPAGDLLGGEPVGSDLLGDDLPGDGPPARAEPAPAPRGTAAARPPQPPAPRPLPPTVPRPQPTAAPAGGVPQWALLGTGLVIIALLLVVIALLVQRGGV